MQLKTNATLKIVEKNNFKGEDGKEVSYFINYLKDDEGGVLETTSGRDFSEFEGQDGVAIIAPRKRTEGGGFKLSLADFIPEATIS